jgi:hypothetical protein
LILGRKMVAKLWLNDDASRVAAAIMVEERRWWWWWWDAIDRVASGGVAFKIVG